MKQEINCVYYYVQQSSLLHRWKWLVKDQIVFYEWTFIKCLHTCDNHDLLCRHLAVFCSTSVIGLSFEQSYANGTLALGTLPFSISKKRGWSNCTLITGLSDESMSDRWPNCAQRSDCQARQSLMMTLWHGYRVRKSKTHRIIFFFNLFYLRPMSFSVQKHKPPSFSRDVRLHQNPIRKKLFWPFSEGQILSSVRFKMNRILLLRWCVQTISLV